MIEKSNALGTAIGDMKKGQWVQTEKKAHEAWAHFSIKKPTASGLLHYMCAFMGEQNALVVSQSVLASRLGVSERTITTAIADLAANQWIQVVRLGKGKECAYVVNDRVAWDKPRVKLCLSLFSATVIANADDQDAIEGPPLRRIPVLFPGERQLPTGPGEKPPAQPSLEGLEPDLPSLEHGQDPWADRRKEIAELESKGFIRAIDESTGEINWVKT